MSKTMADDKPRETVADKYKRLLEQANKLKAQAEEELKADIESKLAELNAFGHEFRLVEGKAPATGKPRGRPKGMKMTPEQKEAMRLGRQKAKEAREKAAHA